MYPSSDGPQYRPGGSANASICVVVALLALLLRYLHKWENKKLAGVEKQTAEAGEQGGKASMESAQGHGRPGFKYVV